LEPGEPELSLAHRIRSTDKPRITKQSPVKESKYLAFIRTLPCVVTGTTPVEAAHVSYPAAEWGALGRGKGQKVSDRFAVPLSPSEHRKQHSMNEKDYWASVGTNPHRIACVIYGIWNERGPEGWEIAVDAIRRMRNANEK
jgi:hypothetical protein